ncbi:MAG TPA: MmgE/PrpD family protein [Dehalococcoidia bacterium]|nr:MmgE/PrpD family protein [Dehalococcoidia bacterium]
MDRTTGMLASYAASLVYSDLTPATVHQAKLKVIDSMGCAMGGYLSEPSKIAQRMAAMYTSTLPARVLGSGRPTSPEMAAFANTVMVRFLDCNDTYSSLGGGHPSDMLPAVLAMGEPMHSTAKEVILAIVAAYDMFGAFADLIPMMSKGWDQGTFIVIGSAVGAGKLLGLSQEQMGHAISLAITPNVPTRQTRAGELSMWKGCATAAAARSGIFAALLAREGMTGPNEAFEGRHGVWEQVTGAYELNPLPRQDGPFSIERVNLKYFPAEYNAQAPLWMAMDIRKKVDPEDIEAIHVQTYWNAWSEIGSEPAKWDPQTRETADHSLPYLLAVDLVDGNITPASFTLERIRDPKLRPLMNRITVSENLEFTKAHPEALMSEMEVVTKSGERFVERSSYPRGHRQNPMTDQEVETKFLGLCQEVLTPQKAQTALDTLWGLEDLPDIGQVIDLFQV